MKFTKMHGLGNDFVIIEEILAEKTDYVELALRMCDRQTGIGADGLVIVMPSEVADVKMKIINSDGSEAEMCGNAIRCFAKYAYEKKLVKYETIRVETLAGIIEPTVLLEGGKVSAVRVNMGEPRLNRSFVPMLGTDSRVINEKIDTDLGVYYITSLLMGVPHTCIFVDNVSDAPVTTLGPIIEKHPLFPRKTNVNFVEIVNEKEIKVRTWERGAGATLACGTGSCASAIAANLNGKTGKAVTVHLKLGSLFIEWAEDGKVFMTGPAAKVFEGMFEA